jgi:hypothetical protein
MKEEYYRLIRDWHHPYKTYPAGSTFNAAIWASYLGANTTEKEFLEFYKSGRFKGWIEKIISR